MLKIVLQRQDEYSNVIKPNNDKKEGSTVGTLIVYAENGENIFTCFTLENAGESTDARGQDKRIIARDYKLEWSASSVALPKEYKGKGLLLTCDDVLKSFRSRRILIHIGNYPQDSEGCILLGYTNKNNGIILDSTKAVKDFYDIVNKYGVHNFILSIKEI